MSVFIFNHTLGNPAGKGIGYGNIDVISRDGKRFDEQCLNQQAGDDFALCKCRLKVFTKWREKLMGKWHICRHTEIVAAGHEAFHVVELHPCQEGELLCLVWQEGANSDVIVVGLLLTLDHDRIDSTIGVLVGLSCEVWETRLFTSNFCCCQCASWDINPVYRTLLYYTFLIILYID